jgi:Mg2+-importing ATPase
MPVFPNAAKFLFPAARTPGPDQRAENRHYLEQASQTGPAVLQALGSTLSGLDDEEVERRLEQHGPNVVAPEARHGWLGFLGRAVANPLVVLLSILAVISLLTGDPRAAVIMAAMVVLGVVLRFVQETRADAAAAHLKAMIRLTTAVVRDGQRRELPLEGIVPGDIIELLAGDMFPADVRLLSSKDLFVSQASLTGESLPVEKDDRPDDGANRTVLGLRNVGFLGTSVESGKATAVVIATGPRTYLGQLARGLSAPPPTAFDRGIGRFTWLMIRFMGAMVPLVFVINGLTKHDWEQAFFFAMAVAVGMTPEMLPMIVTVCLSRGAMAMSRKKVIVKRLNAIQDLGAMDVLCTDKTGTLTQDHILLETHCNVVLEEDVGVLELAYLNSHFQTGLRNLLDRAILKHNEIHEQIDVPDFTKVDEIPFDFERKVMSVVVRTGDGVHRIITKGAPEEIFKRSTQYELDGRIQPISPLIMHDMKEEYERLSADGFRVLAIGFRDLEGRTIYTRDDERGLTLRGYLAFLDPPRETAREALAALGAHGVAIKVLTGDNELVSRKICSEVGIAVASSLVGWQVDQMSDLELAQAVESASLFARLSPQNKQRIIRVLRNNGHVVGFLGDGINDAPALRAADVGVSVDSAVDIAKESADFILLEKSLIVLGEGVMEGRKVFANILKYIRMGASSSFGNMFSVVGASAFLPFVPMLPIQILTNNLLYDFSQVPIPTDEVDPDQLTRPRPWTMGDIARFILFIGPCSSVFDYITYLVMIFVFGCWSKESAGLFQTGWFVESLLTQTLIIHVIRTNRIPWLQSRPSWQLTLTTLAVMALGVWLPVSPLGPVLGFKPLPWLYWPILALILLGYLALTQVVKLWLVRHGWVR